MTAPAPAPKPECAHRWLERAVTIVDHVSKVRTVREYCARCLLHRDVVDAVVYCEWRVD